MQSRDVLAHTVTLTSTDRPTRTVTTAESTSTLLEEELRRFLGEVRGDEPGTFELSWRGVPGTDQPAEVPAAMPADVEAQQVLAAFLEPVTAATQELPETAAAAATSLSGRAHEPSESHAPELVGTRVSARVTSNGSRGSGSATELAMVSAVERAMAAFKAQAADLTVRLEASERVSAAHAQRVDELELERSTVLKTAEYLEAQRASLAEEVQEAWAAHEGDEQARLALEAALSEARASHASELAVASDEILRLERRLRELESVHTETLALNAVLRIEVERLRARLDDACATVDADRASFDASTLALSEARAENARAREALKGTLADLEDLSSWARAKSARLAETLRDHGAAIVE